MHIVKKESAAPAAADPLDYVMSDATVDRYGDVIEQDGWQLANFRKNPIALFGHDSRFVVGHWRKVRVESGALVGRLELIDAVSDRLKEIHAAVKAGVLRAVSVGFRPLAAEPIEGDKGGTRFLKSELVECSLVAIGANPNALAVVKALNLSDDVTAMILGKPADQDRVVRRGVNGETADIPRIVRSGQMSLAKKIEGAEQEVLALKDQVTEVTSKDGDLGEEDLAKLDELNNRLTGKQDTLAALKRAEVSLAQRSELVTATALVAPRVPATVAKDIKPADRVLRSLVAVVGSHATRGHKSAQQVLLERYGDDGKIDDATRTVFDVVTRAASAPATTTTSGWASQLVETSFAGFLELLMPASAYPGLASRGLRLNFGRSGVISVPSRAATPTIAGSFVAEGSPIPVRQGAFAAITFTPKKMAVISTFTREIAEHSTPAIEGLIKDAIREDTSVALDTVLLDATAASSTRPAGLRNGVAAITATAGGGFAALVGDIKALLGALITASNGNVRNPVWLMNPVQAIAIALTQNAGGDFPFAMEMNNNRLQGYPVILSANVTAAQVILVDAGDFVAIEGGEPRFDVSDQATLHMEDTTPLAIGTTGTPNTVAAPVRSLFQTDSMALRMIMDVNWGMRRTGMVRWTETVTW